MKILSALQIREADYYTIQNEPIPSILLMERAANKVVDIIINEFPSTQRVKHIFCGTGNNGGDGLALARLLSLHEHPVKVYLLEGNPSKDYSFNLKKVKDIPKIECVSIQQIAQLPTFHDTDIIIDAIFGTGLNKPLQGNIKKIVQHLNQLDHIYRIAIDIPTGLFAEQPHQEKDTVFNAHRVYTFHAPKLAFLLPENEKYVNSFKVLDIRLASEFTENMDSPNYYLEKRNITEKYIARNKFSHKGNYGHSLIIAGSRGKTGAAILASRAALKSGSGLVTTHIPHDGVIPLQTSAPEAMCNLDNHPIIWTELPTDIEGRTVGVGPGIGVHPKTREVFKELLSEVKSPMVIDADAINMLSSDPSLLTKIPKNSILTPHPKEFERLVGSWKNDYERLEIQKKFSIQNQLIVVLKGAHTSISDIQGNIYFNSTGNSGMATAGSGDVLTGTITALLAQSYPPIDAAIVGVYIHGLAGNMALESESKESLIASDIIKNLGKAFNFVS